MRLDDRGPTSLKLAKLQDDARLRASVTLQTYAFGIRFSMRTTTLIIMRLAL